MRQADASDVCESASVITSPAAPLQHELSAENPLRMARTYSSFADQIRAADRVQSFGFDRRARLMSSNRFL
eukprot:5228836-Pyramimonas_sp.AAC.1